MQVPLPLPPSRFMPGSLIRGSLRLILAAVLLWPACAAAAEVSGEQVYRAKCAQCHGADGAGTKQNKKRLEGGLSVAQLAEVIGETMPEDAPGSLAPAESQAVAAYVHATFYSEIARARRRPARIELARLTVRQYRQAVSDLIGSFRSPLAWSEQRGLTGEYFSGRRIGGRRGQATKRVDSRVDFDFGREAPVDKIADRREFSIRWTGSVQAAETGEYEFVVRTEHAARLWVNDNRQPLIDAWVKSGDETQYKANLYLLGGRAYPIRLEFTKAKQGVDDSKKRKNKPPSAPASIALCWRRPEGVLEPIPTRNLAPHAVSESFVCDTPFPPDDRSYGWERGVSVSKAWDQATTDAAIEATGYIDGKLDELAKTRDGASGRTEKLRAFCHTFVERAFRRPLSDEQAKTYIDDQFSAADDARQAVKRVVLLSLKSPRFLFREVSGSDADAFDVAARLSFGLWDSLPDDELLAAARDGRLNSKEQVARQAERMLADRRAKTKLRGFLLTWLKVDSGVDLSKDTEQFPNFSPEAIAGLRTSLELFLDDVVWSESSDYRELLLADEVFLSGELAKLYGAKAGSEAGFAPVKLDDGQRAGVLTHPYLMARFAHRGESSPIHRGVFLARGVLGQSLRPPPEAVTPLPPELHPGMTTRERVALQTKTSQCMICHGIINPLGFTLEHFDAIGRYRQTDRDKPVDSSGSYRTAAGKKVTIDNARELASFLAGNEEAHAAFVEQLFHHLVQQSTQAYGLSTVDTLRKSFAAGEFNIRKLAIAIMANSALVGRESAPRKTQSASK